MNLVPLSKVPDLVECRDLVTAVGREWNAPAVKEDTHGASYVPTRENALVPP